MIVPCDSLDCAGANRVREDGGEVVGEQVGGGDGSREVAGLEVVPDVVLSAGGRGFAAVVVDEPAAEGVSGVEGGEGGGGD